MKQVQVNSKFVQIGSTKYATDKITSFEVLQRQDKVQGANNRFLMLFFGVAITLIGAISGLVGAIEFKFLLASLGILGSAAGVWIVNRARKMADDSSFEQTVYELMLTTNAGELAAFETTEHDEMKQLEITLEQAIIDARR